ncbi:MAG: 50S ribosomal protein L29 [Nitrososphaeraceae archaeon]
MNDRELTETLEELASELTKLRSEGAKRTLKQETASIRWTRRDIARIKTILTERVENN